MNTHNTATIVVWGAIGAFRVWNALFVRTYFNPDEFWQSIEVAHRMVFGYGHLTWEWQQDHKIRGYAHPLLFALLYKILALLGLDTRWAIAYGPRVVQGLFTAMTDFFVYRLAKVYFDRSTARWTLFCHLFSWFTFYTMVRPFSNSIETLCTTIALSYWPWSHQQQSQSHGAQGPDQSNRVLALVCAACGVLLRPTNAVLWVFLGLNLLLRTKTWQAKARLVACEVVPIAIVTLLAMLVIDWIGYGETTLVLVNFLRFNVFEGNDKLYGVHPWHWYLTQGFPANTGTFLPFFIVGLVTAPRSRKELGLLIGFVLAVYSFSAHKEFRFILPLLPPTIVYAAHCLSTLERRLYLQMHQHTQRVLLTISIGLILIPNTIVAVYLARWHQRAPIEVMDYLASKIQDESAFTAHFWTPCHATPYYSSLHANVSLWFPDCSPVNRFRPGGSESDQFQADPFNFVKKWYPQFSLKEPNAAPEHIGRDHQLPDFVVTFANSARVLRPLLEQAHYRQDASFFHSHMSGDAENADFSDEMLVFSLRESSKK